MLVGKKSSNCGIIIHPLLPSVRSSSPALNHFPLHQLGRISIHRQRRQAQERQSIFHVHGEKVHWLDEREPKNRSEISLGTLALSNSRLLHGLGINYSNYSRVFVWPLIIGLNMMNRLSVVDGGKMITVSQLWLTDLVSMYSMSAVIIINSATSRPCLSICMKTYMLKYNPRSSSDNNMSAIACNGYLWDYWSNCRLVGALARRHRII